MKYTSNTISPKKEVHPQRLCRVGWGVWLCLLLTGCGGLQPAGQVAPAERELSPDYLNRAIDLSTAYLINACEPNGQFIYRVNSAQPAKTTKRYNVLRHAGTMYALAQAYQHQPNDNVLRVLLSAGRFLTSRCMARLPGSNDMLGIWSLPPVTHSKKPPQIKLGGTGLGLAALIRVEKIKPGTTAIADLRKLGRFLLHMQKPNGDFYSKFIPSEGGRYDKWRSLYYPAQAALGLLLLNDVSPSERWVTAATKALAYLFEQRDMTTSDHWSLIAGAKLLSIENYPTNILPRKRIIQYTVQVCESILQEQILYADNPDHIGGYSIEGRTTPTATRVEGLAAALTIIEHEDALLKKTVKSSMLEALHFLLQAQIIKGRYAGGVPRGVGRIGNNKRFNRRVGEIRIDYVQHALSAMIMGERNIFQY